uniref:BTB domain-containing protein n=1 Tax=Periophthalmus magnuspinnatus TaxID=409849 RepID=A0A3B4BD47_9GOBI
MAELLAVIAGLPSSPSTLNVTYAVQDGASPPAAPPVPLSSEDYLFVESRHPSTVLQGLNSLRLNNAFCDVTLCCGGQEFPCHRIVLASFSSYFQVSSARMRFSLTNNDKMNDIEPQMIGMLVSYAYTSEVYISKANVQALLAAANLLDVMAVREACCRFMERQMDEMNCVGIHCFAEAHSCKVLEKRSMDYILEHFSSVYQQEEFLSLCVDKLTEIIASDHLNVPKEEVVFEAAVLWLNKCPSRKQNFEKVLENVRLPLISPYYLHDVIESLDVVKDNQACQRLISEAKDYLLLKDRRGELYCPRARPRRSTGKPTKSDSLQGFGGIISMLFNNELRSLRYLKCGELRSCH